MPVPGRDSKEKASTAGPLERDDEDLKVAIMQLAAKGKLTKIAQVWAEGMDIDWDVLYGYEKPLRIHLPVYPLLRNIMNGGRTRRKQWKQHKGLSSIPCRRRTRLTYRAFSFVPRLLEAKAFLKTIWCKRSG